MYCAPRSGKCISNIRSIHQVCAWTWMLGLASMFNLFLTQIYIYHLLVWWRNFKAGSLFRDISEGLGSDFSMHVSGAKIEIHVDIDSFSHLLFKGFWKHEVCCRIHIREHIIKKTNIFVKKEKNHDATQCLEVQSMRTMSIQSLGWTYFHSYASCGIDEIVTIFMWIHCLVSNILTRHKTPASELVYKG